jgi:hypothetical protein
MVEGFLAPGHWVAGCQAAVFLLPECWDQRFPAPLWFGYSPGDFLEHDPWDGRGFLMAGLQAALSVDFPLECGD